MGEELGQLGRPVRVRVRRAPTTSARARATSVAARSSIAGAAGRDEPRPQRAAARRRRRRSGSARRRSPPRSSPASRRASSAQIRRGRSRRLPAHSASASSARLHPPAQHRAFEPVDLIGPCPGRAAKQRDDRRRRPLAGDDREQLEQARAGGRHRQRHARLGGQRDAEASQGRGRSAGPADRGCGPRSRSRPDRPRRRAGARSCGRSAPPRPGRRRPRAGAAIRREGPRSNRARTGCARDGGASPARRPRAPGRAR